MKIILSLVLGMVAGLRVMGAETNVWEQVKTAAAKLKGETNYSWTVKVELPTLGFTPSPMEGKTEKDGFTLVSQEFNGANFEAAFKGEKKVVNLEGSWVAVGTNADEAAMGWWLVYTKTAAGEAADLLGKTKGLKAGDDGALSGDLTEEGAKDLLTFGRRGAGGPPPPKNAKASVKFWVKEGGLTKYQAHVTGTVAFAADQDPQEMDMTRTVEVHDIGKTKVEPSAEAKKALEGK